MHHLADQSESPIAFTNVALNSDRYEEKKRPPRTDYFETNFENLIYQTHGRDNDLKPYAAPFTKMMYKSVTVAAS